MREQEIRIIIGERGIVTLTHFTRVNNLPGILKHGIMPSKDIDPETVTVNDKLRYDGQPEAVSLSVSFPNYQMFYKYRNADSDHWAVLKIDPSVLWERDCAFCIQNAASGTVSNIPVEERRQPDALRKMFSDFGSEISGVKRESLDIPSSYPTNPQAEVLVFGGVPTDYFRSIHLESHSLAVALATALSQANINLPVEANSLYFSPRRDWKRWSEYRDAPASTDLSELLRKLGI